MNEPIYTSLDDLPIVLTVEQMRKILQIGRNKAYNMINAGEIRTIKIGEHTRIPKSELVRFIKGEP